MISATSRHSHDMTEIMFEVPISNCTHTHAHTHTHTHAHTHAHTHTDTHTHTHACVSYHLAPPI